jgi:hypothetical protein
LETVIVRSDGELVGAAAPLFAESTISAASITLNLIAGWRTDTHFARKMCAGLPDIGLGSICWMPFIASLVVNGGFVVVVSASFQNWVFLSI